jgi:FMN phosphatase YigB (HAD superfamily)
MTKALIFDLDNCLAPANEVGEELFEPAFDAIRRANHGTVSNEALELAFADYGDLPILAELPAQHFLVTSGFRRLQESKIKALNLAPFFTALYVDAIDEPDRLGKQGVFARILTDYELTSAEVLVVGDNADSEIRVGNHLGMRTVQTLRPGVPRASTATFHIHSLSELRKLLSDPSNDEA